MDLYYDRLLTPEEIAPLILSPRKVSSGVDVRTVRAVLDYFDVYHHVEDTLPAPHALKMLAPHTEMIIEIVKSTPWLFLDEISAELDTRCHVKYLPGYCCAMLKRRGYSVQVMRHIARQRDEKQRFRYFLALSRIMMRPSQLVFADEVGQDGRGSRRRRGWAEVGAGCDITEFLNRGKHISILAVYWITGFIDFDHKEGGYSAEDFISAVEFMIIPHLRPYPQDNSIFVLRQLPDPPHVQSATARHGGGCWREATVPRPVLPHRQPHRVRVQLVQGLLAAARVVAERRPAACEDRFLLAELRVKRRGCGGYVQEVWICLVALAIITYYPITNLKT